MKKKIFTVRALVLVTSILISVFLLDAVVGKNTLWKSIKKSFAGEVRYIDPIFTNVTTTKDVKYGTAGGQNLMMDVYEPVGDTETSRIAVILVHGGGFHSGDKSGFGNGGNNGNAPEFAKRGYVAFPINYRLSEHEYQTITPAAMGAIQNAKNDTLTAVKFIQSNAAKYRIDPNKIVVGGFSAGAVTALYAAYDNPNPSSKVALAVSFSGGMLPESINLIQSGEPPAVLIHSSNDEIVQIETAQLVYDRLTALGIPAELDIYEVGHATPAVAEAQEKVREFIVTNLGLSGYVAPVAPNNLVENEAETSEESGGEEESDQKMSRLEKFAEFLPGLNIDEAQNALDEGGPRELYRYVVKTGQFTNEQIVRAAKWWLSR